MTQNTQPTKSEKPYNLEPNVEAALAYFMLPITGILVYMLEKENEFVRFHAMQSIIFGIVAFVAWQFAVFTTPILIGIVLLPIVTLGTFIIWLLLMWRAYNNETWHLPYIGKIAKDQIGR